MVPVKLTVRKARQTAERLLVPLGDRWRHTQGVAARAAAIAAAVGENERELLVVAAWCHDLGYAPALRITGMHQLDGARYLAAGGYSTRLCALVAHHSAATFEAEERGFLSDLLEWPREESALVDALWTADMTIGPSGEQVDYSGRLKEILGRYDPDSPVARAMLRAKPSIEAAIDRTQKRLDDQAMRG